MLTLKKIFRNHDKNIILLYLVSPRILSPLNLLIIVSGRVEREARGGGGWGGGRGEGGGREEGGGKGGNLI